MIETMKKAGILLLLPMFFTLPAPAAAADFSLFGVRMGMARQEVKGFWQPLENGEYLIRDSILLNVLPEFDHRDRLYRVSFTMPIPLMDRYPAPMVTTSFQEAIQGFWNLNDLTVSVRTGRGAADITITSRSLLAEMEQHIDIQVGFEMTTALKP